MSETPDTPASRYVHEEVRLRIAGREIVENARRIFELCESLGIDPDSISEDWKKEDIGIVQEVIDNTPVIKTAEYDGQPVFFTSRAVATGGDKLERLRPVAEMLEYHIRKHVILLGKLDQVKEEKETSSRNWITNGHFHWCSSCNQVFGCDSPNEDGKVSCTFCGKYGEF
jgi:hypothetical protein